MTSNTFSKHDQDFADAMATKLRLNREKNKRNLQQTKKNQSINTRTKKEIGEFRLSLIREGLKEFPDLDPLTALKMMEEIGAGLGVLKDMKGIY